jgi:hypothetical protein
LGGGGEVVKGGNGNNGIRKEVLDGNELFFGGAYIFAWMCLLIFVLVYIRLTRSLY